MLETGAIKVLHIKKHAYISSRKRKKPCHPNELSNETSESIVHTYTCLIAVFVEFPSFHSNKDREGPSTKINL